MQLAHTLPSLSVEESCESDLLSFCFRCDSLHFQQAGYDWKTAVWSPCTLFLTHVHTRTLPCSCTSSRLPKCHGNRTAATVTAGSFSYWWGGRLPGRPALLLLARSLVSPLRCRPEILMTFFLCFSFFCLSVSVCLCVRVMSLSFSRTDTHQVSTLTTRGEQRQCNSEDMRIVKGHVFLYPWKTSSDLLASSG